MSRPLRIEFAGAVYHVISRGDRRGAIYYNDSDRLDWQGVLARVCDHHHFVVHGFCQMGNHYHLLLETPEANLARGMRELNGIYSQHFNHRHDLVGHLFQGRYKAMLVQRDRYLLELIRYIVLNPVRAQLVSSADDWRWSSHRYFLDTTTAPAWLAYDWILSQFGPTRDEALASYRKFVTAGTGQQGSSAHLSHPLLLGDDAFIAIQQQAQHSKAYRAAPREQRRALTLSLAQYQSQFPDRDEAMARAYLSTVYTMTEIAAAFQVSRQTVCRAIAGFGKKG